MPGTKGLSVTARLSGELDHFSADGVRAMLDGMLEDRRVRYLVLDLSDMTFMDSSGVGVIIGRYKRLVARGGGVRVFGANAQVDMLFKLSGLYKIVEKCDRAGEAV
ncbi:MAG TPA: anti-sigma factor antagonist [Candidatus Fimadaptatus faecigallinarum]|uniref:Anti-sigma factor antagonist n=1 Tax=Candidatus Fimadaptatus faecigallinarum TaxID=2840814 RepID=A0A9D1LSD4_9FIRM|nr:anti-sigma factor antagonist [Candidatus Fimadaptatus faecigallinarum]